MIWMNTVPNNAFTLKVAPYQSTRVIRLRGYQSLGKKACPSIIIVIGMCDVKNATKAIRVVPWMLFILHKEYDIIMAWVRSYSIGRFMFYLQHKKALGSATIHLIAFRSPHFDLFSTLFILFHS